MARLVPETPNLPRTSNSTNTALYHFDNDLNKMLFTYLSDLARRANAGLQTDGSNEMTGDLIFDKISATIALAENTGTLHISGGTAYSEGGALVLRGGTHATQANDILFYSNNTVRYQWDQSASTHTFTGTMRVDGNTTITSDDAGVGALPIFTLERASPSPAVGDLLGYFNWRGKDSAGNNTTYVDMFPTINDPTDGSEDGSLSIRVVSGGTVANRIVANAGGVNLYETVTLIGGRLAFPAVANPSTNVNTLDDYEEGSWTPSMAFDTPGTSSFAYTLQDGYYIKIGKLVFLRGRVTFTPTIGTGTGQIRVINTPFASSSAAGSAGSGPVNNMNASWVWPAGATSISVQAASNATNLVISSIGNGIAVANFTQANVTDGLSHILVFSLVYEAAT